MSAATKKELIEACEAYVNSKLTNAQKVIDDLEAALKLETKCSMGDKYETDRAMLHLEFEKVAGQSEAFKKLRRTIRSIPAGRVDKNVIFGSAVRTTGANYFIAIPAGEITGGGEKYYAVGANAPVAQLLLNHCAGDVVELNGKNISIEEVF